jgi:hypothetical protein
MPFTEHFMEVNPVLKKKTSGKEELLKILKNL